MTPNHKPNWLENAPHECVEYWQRCFLDEITYHNQIVAEFGKHLTEAEIAEDFAQSYQLSTLSKIEKLLTVPEAQPLWEKLSNLKVNPFHFSIAFQLALNGGSIISYTKEDAKNAEMIEAKTLDLIQTLKAANYHESFFVGLNEILKRAQADQRIYQRQKQIIPAQTKKAVIDDVYFRKSLADFFEKHTQQARHDLTLLCANIAFSEKFSYEKIKRTVNRNNKNSKL